MNLLQELHPEHTGRISRLWRSEALQAAYGRRNRFQLVQCAKYFLDRCESVLEEDYVPNDQDIVQTRVKTTGIVEHDFEITPKGEKPRRLILVNTLNYVLCCPKTPNKHCQRLRDHVYLDCRVQD